MLSPTSARILQHVLDDQPFRPLLDGAQRPAHQAEWRAFVAEMTASPPATLEEAERFHDHWQVSHHYLRELVDDEAAVLAMLRVWLPPYRGADLALYRGENVDRYEAGRLGIAWTREIEKARMFASGLNAMGSGGVLLRCLAPSSAIIAAPSGHSGYIQEGEFTVDPRSLENVQVLERYPRAF
jgi:hypothetical protein